MGTNLHTRAQLGVQIIVLRIFVLKFPNIYSGRQRLRFILLLYLFIFINDFLRNAISSIAGAVGTCGVATRVF
jgi:hypothetical protein